MPIHQAIIFDPRTDNDSGIRAPILSVSTQTAKPGKRIFRTRNRRQAFGAVRGIVWSSIICWMLAGSLAMGQSTLVIDSFSAVWPHYETYAAQSSYTTTEGGVACLALPSIFTEVFPMNRAIWERTRTPALNLSTYSTISIRVNSTRKSTWASLQFQTTSGGWYSKYFFICSQWTTLVFPRDSFTPSGDVTAGWNSINKTRLALWQLTGDLPLSTTAYVADLRADTNLNLFPNSNFEVTTSEAMPDYWGPGSWGATAEQWVVDMDSWRSRWSVDQTVNHTSGGTNSLRIISSSPSLPELTAMANWSELVKDHTYTMSAWLRSDQANFPVTFQVNGCTCLPSSNTSITTPPTVYTWERYSFTFTPTSSADFSRISCIINPTGNGTLWVDDVQLEEATTATMWHSSLKDRDIAQQTVHKSVSWIGDHTITPGGSSVTVNIDGNGRFLVDGQPFIPIGVYWETGLPSVAITQKLAQTGFNTVVPCLASSLSSATIRTFLDSAKTNGLKVIAQAGSAVPIATLQSWINDLKDHPAIIMWYVYDEPSTSAQWTDANAKYAAAKAADPSRPAMVNVAYPLSRISSDYSSDVLSMDYYPIVNADCNLYVGCISTLGSKVETQHQVALAAGKPSWNWLQSVGYAYFMFREPTGAEAEAMAYLSLIHGSRGLMYFSRVPRTAEPWNEVRILTDEIKTLTPVFYSTETAPTTSSNSSSIHLLNKRYNGRDYVIAVNESPFPVTAELNSAWEAGTVLTNVLFENRNVTMVNGKITDTFAGYQRHVYSFAAPVAHWKLNETSGTTAADSSSNAINGALTNMDPAIDWVTGKNGNALDFDGVNDYVNVPNAGSLNPISQITICFWLKAPSVPAYGMMLSKNHVSQYAVMWYSTTGRIRFDLNPWFNYLNPLISTNALSLNQWHHVACTFDGVNAKIYLDGTLDKTSSSVSGAISVGTDALHIGDATDARCYYSGTLDDVRIYNYALTSSEIATLATP